MHELGKEREGVVGGKYIEKGGNWGERGGMGEVR